MHNRRQFISGTSAAILAALAGCADGSGTATSEETPTNSPTPTQEPTPTPTEDGTQTESPTATATDGTGGANSSSVSIEGFAYNPLRLSVEPGTTVTWTNEDGASHDVVSDTFTEDGTDWSFRSPVMGEYGSTKYTFEEAGAFEYYCSIHGASSMCGVVVVGDASHDATLPCE